MNVVKNLLVRFVFLFPVSQLQYLDEIKLALD